MAKSKKGTFPLAFQAGTDTSKSRSAEFSAWYGDYYDWLTKSAKGQIGQRLKMKAKAKFDLAPEDNGAKKMSSNRKDNEDY